MKWRFLFLICFAAANLFSSICFGQKASMQIHIYDNRTSDTPFYYDRISIYKNGKIFNDSNARYSSNETFRNLDTGIYFIKYRSFFNRDETKKIVINNYKKYQVDLCLNYIDTVNQVFNPLILQLKNHDSYQIIFRSQGCDHHTQDTLLITKDDTAYIALFRSKSKKLSELEIKMIIQFEHELKHIDLGCNCRTADYYTVEYYNTKIYILDKCCHWKGYNYIKRELFNIDR